MPGFISHALRAVAAEERRGFAAVEFALIAPVLLVMLAGVLDFANLLFTGFQLDASIAAGMQYALNKRSDVGSANGASLATSVATIIANTNGTAWANTTVVVNNGPSMTITNGTASAGGTAANADSCYCPTGTAPNWSWGTAHSASSCGTFNCTGGSVAGQFVTITASRRVTTFLPLAALGASSTLTQSAIVETQ